jgi:phosphoribosylaminoimidazole-succinocarboxamide synthase
MTQEPVVTRVDLPGIPLFRRGKVRDVFDLGDRLLVVATDRLSAFDVILEQGIPGKGRVLNQISRFWFERLAAIVPHHCLSIDVADFPPPLHPHRSVLEGRSMLCLRTAAIPIECVVRGYLAGSGYKEYRERGAVSGIALPPGLRQSERLPRPLFTPSTKAETGHDENISRDEVGKRVGAALAAELESVSLALYHAAARHALDRGIVIADTKFEFGIRDGKLLLIDEALTPDSSRFWKAAEIRAGEAPPSFDKQPVRDWLEASGWSKEPPPPDLPAAVVAATSERYQAILDILTRPD